MDCRRSRGECLLAYFGDSCRHHSGSRVSESGTVSHVLPSLWSVGNAAGAVKVYSVMSWVYRPDHPKVLGGGTRRTLFVT